MNSGIYEIVCTATGKRYIGSSCKVRSRWKTHRWLLDRGTHHSPHLQSSWAKYGVDAFAFRVLLVCDKANLVLFEQRAIDTLRPAFNVAPFASMPNGVPVSAAGRARLSARMKGNTNTLGFKHSPESRALFSRIKMGNTATKGRKLDPAHVEKVAASHRGKKRSAESRARMSAAMTGKKQKPRSAEWRAKLSAALTGKPKSLEHIEKMKATKRARRAERAA